MRRKIRNLVALMLILALSAGLISGCGKGKQRNAGGDGQQTGNASETGSGSVSSGDGTDGGYGCYVEEELTLPEQIQSGEEGVFSILKDTQERIVVYAGAVGEENIRLSRYVLQPDDSWKEEQEAWMTDARWSRNRLPGGFSCDEEGNLYITAMVMGEDEEGNPTWSSEFYRVAAGTETAEKLELDQQSGGMGTSCLYPGGDGKVLLMPSSFPCNMEVRELATGRRLFEFLPGNGSACWYGDQILTVSERGTALLLLNSETGEQERSIQIREEEPEAGALDSLIMYGEEGTGIWVASRDGLMYLAEGGSKWEVLLDAGMSVMGMPSCYVNKLIRTEEDVFYLSYLNRSYEDGLVRIRYKEGAGSTGQQTLHIYSLEECDSIRQAIVEFQREHIGVKVEYRAVMSENSSATREDCIQALNTELLAGKGADLLVTDGLPYASYVEKGVLADLSELLADLNGEGYMLENIAEAVRKADGETGGICRIPTRMTMSMWIGTEEALEAADSLEQLAAASAGAEKPYLGEKACNYLGLYQALYQVYGQELIKDGQTDRGRIRTFLQGYLTLAEQSGTEEEFFMEEGAINAVCGNQGALGYYEIEKTRSLLVPEAVLRESRYDYRVAGNSFVPQVSIAINRASENQELAAEFIRKLLSDSIQGMDLDGLPVNPQAIEKNATERDENVGVGMHYEKLLPDGTREPIMLISEWPETEELQEFFSRVKKLDTLRDTELTVQDILEREIPALWRGEKDVETVSESIYQKLQTWLAE